jgi:enterochelin esterase-like enzyme
MAVRTSRTQLWLENLGEWTWPGQGGAAAAEILPPAWIPRLPPRPAPALRPAPPVASAGRARARRIVIAALLSALAATCLALAQGGQLTLAGIVSLRGASSGEVEAPAVSSSSAAQPLPTLEPVSEDAAGSEIARASYRSPALRASGSFLVYLPAGYDASAARYPVVYLLTGQDQSDEAFLQVGLQDDLDRLIGERAITPLIAVMVQGGPGANLWRNHGAARYESYVLEVQQLVDRMLATVPARDARAIVGDSMGGYGAMNAALANPYRFGVVESWIGFFDGLSPALRADAPIFARLGLHAFVYGARDDRIANPNEDLPFAAALRAAHADARGAVYAGEHDLETVGAHLERMLAFAGRALRVPASESAASSARVADGPPPAPLRYGAR